jgi:DNA mismatch repair protein MutL
MVCSIQPLKTDLIRRMAAGEVIDSFIAVIRELIENALDASATRLAISFWPEPGTVEISDNGVGLTWENLHRAALPHTTSKISALEHLSHLTTLGFRGEALHSLAQLGQLEIRSRAIAADTGWHVLYDPQGAVVSAMELAMAPGTIVTVSRLFETWPSRQQTTPISSLLRHIQDLVGDYALCHPQVTWQLYQNERPWLTVAPGTNAKEILLQLLKKVSPEALHYASFSATASLPQDASTAEGLGTIRLLLGFPDRYHRHRPDWIRVAVNGRRAFVNTASPEPWGLGPLEQKLLAAFRQTLPRHRYPLCWVHLQVPSPFVDWHRTASKSQIYLHALEDWSQQITQHMQTALDLSPAEVDTVDSRIRQILKSAEATGTYHLSTLSTSSSLSDPLPTETSTSDDQPLGELRAIAQLHQTYIVAEHPTGLWLVEQHVAHERVLYEQLLQDCQFIPLETPLPLNDLSEQQVQHLTHLGFSIEPFGQNLWAIRTVPSLLAQQPDCPAIITELSRCTALQPALVTTACRSAIRNGEALTLIQMQTLLDAWQRTKHPRTCPHGRPIYLRLDEPALAKFFRRHWIVGKR